MHHRVYDIIAHLFFEVLGTLEDECEPLCEQQLYQAGSDDSESTTRVDYCRSTRVVENFTVSRFISVLLIVLSYRRSKHIIPC